MAINDSRRLDPRQQRCDELADWLAETGAQRGLRLLQSTGWWPEVSPSEVASRAKIAEATDPGRPRAISIWQPMTLDGEVYFERPVPSPLGDHYCRQRRIRRAKTAGIPRICWFGESAAAGYLYSPRYSPAMELQSRFSAPSEASPAAEVVDLARTNETLGSLVTTVAAAQQLAPDVLVIYAGNNCQLLELPERSPWYPSVRSRQELAALLRQGGLAAVMRQSRRRLRKLVRGRLDDLVHAAAGVPMILVLPEVDLLGWHQRQPVPWLPAGGVAEWYRLYDRALTALDHEVYGEALKAAECMVELDSGLCPTAQRIRCQALLGLGNSEEALAAARDEVDAADYAVSCFLGAPQAGSLVAQEWRRAAANHEQATLVDSRIWLARVDGLPDPAHFVDYCHLSVVGIRRLVDGIVEELSRRDLASATEPRGSVANGARPSPQVEALAQLGAAVHAAHRWTAVGGRGAGLRARCRAALAACPEVKDAMWQLLEARCAPLPAVLTAAQQRNQHSPFAFELQHGWRWYGLDVELLEALVMVLEETAAPKQRGEVRQRVDEWLQRHHALAVDGTDISRQPYLWDPLEQSFVDAMATPDQPRRSFFKAYWPASRFALIAAASSIIDAELILRAPYAVPGQEAVVELNGREMARLELTETWRRHQLSLSVSSQSSLVEAIHQLTIRWPLPSRDSSRAGFDVALGLAIERLESGRSADFHPVFGEVLSVVCKLRPDTG